MARLRLSRRQLAVGVLVLVLGVTVGASAHPLEQDPEVAAALTVLDAWISATVAEREQPGLSIGIVVDQDLVWAKGYGFSDLENEIPTTPRTAYRIASNSKLFTATAILQLRDSGKLGLDDPVASHLDWFDLKNAHPDGPTITIRHLITHTSGMPRMSAAYGDERYPPREKMIRLLADQETIFPAETKFKYSNLAFAIAGEVVAAVSGQPYHEYVTQQILEPLGMLSTHVRPRPNMPGLAQGYGVRVPGAERDVEAFADWRGLTPAANLASTVEDLAKFAALQLREEGVPGGAQVLKPSTVREMHRVQWLRPDWQSGRGLGFAIYRIGDQVRVGHGGSTAGFRTQVMIAPAEKFAVIVLTNANDGEPGRYVNQAFSIVGPAVSHATHEPSTHPDPDPAWANYVGSYTRQHSDVHILVLNGRLSMIVPDAENPWETRVTLDPVQSPHAFRMDGGSYDGELLVFDVDETGRATRLLDGSNYRLRK